MTERGERSTRHAFTIDVEEWFQAIPISAEMRGAATPRLERSLDTLLELLASANVRATLFWLGPAARDNPELLRRSAAAGHEIGCHGWSHDLVYSMTPDRFRDETRRAVDVIQDLTGTRVTSYRAAYFSVTAQSLWALETLVQLGFQYDSSIFPVKNWRYGIPGFRRDPHQIATPSGPIYEFPMSVRRVFGRDLPASGGAYFRIYPYAITSANLAAAERAGAPTVFYLHPWEVDPEHPRVPFHWKPRLTHYVNLRSTVPKLKRLLRDFRFSTLSDVWDDTNARSRTQAL